MPLPIAQLTAAKTPEQAADVVRSWTRPVDPDALEPLDRFITRRELLDVLHGDMPGWAEDVTPADSATAQAGSSSDGASAQAGRSKSKRATS